MLMDNIMENSAMYSMSNNKDIFLNQQGFWLDPRAAKVRSTRKRWADGSAQYEDQCLVLLSSAGVRM